MLNAIKTFDAYPKTLDDFRDKWVPGACISMTSMVAIILIVVGEIASYQSVTQKHHMYVDTEVTGTLDVHLNITFFKVPCAVLNIDAVDGFGDTVASISRSIVKTRLSEDGEELHKEDEKLDENGHQAAHSDDVAHIEVVKQNGYCGSCYGAEDSPKQCCNTCDEVRAAYEKKSWQFGLFDTIEQCAQERLAKKLAATRHEGCNIQGDIKVNKVAGALHLAPGKSLLRNNMVSLSELLGFSQDEPQRAFDISHTINKLGFGKEFPKMINPLDNRVHKRDNGLYQFHIKVVPTRFENLAGTVLETNQYSVTEHFNRNPGTIGPGVYFSYDLSPIKVHISESLQHRSLLHFFVSLCAAVGGIFTVAGLVDSVLYHGHRKISGKND